MPKVTKIVQSKALAHRTARLRVAAYCRVSTDHDDQIGSLEAQTNHYIYYIGANPEWECAGIYVDDGISGTKKEKRPELLQLLADCESRKIDFIVTKSISRFARNTTDCLEIVRRLTDLGVHVFFEKENIDTHTMDGELMLTILSSLAEHESVSNSQNYKWGIQKRFRTGSFKLSYAPYGYDCVDGNLIVNSRQAEVVRRIFREALAGFGSQRIAERLSKDGIPSRRGTKWYETSVLDILRNEKYVGDCLLQKTYSDDRFYKRNNHGERDMFLTHDCHAAIISRADFEAVGVLLDHRCQEKGIGITGKNFVYPFTGKIHCVECGGTFKRRSTTKAVKRPVTWCCSRHLKDTSKCSMLPIREDSIESAFVMMINKLVYGSNFVLKPLRQALQLMDDASIISRVRELDGKIREIADQVKVLTTLLAQGYLEPAFYHKQNNELSSEFVMLKERRATIASDSERRSSALAQTELLLKYVSSQEGRVEFFEKSLFDRFVYGIDIFSATEVGFRMKCGITLRERLVWR